APFRVRADSVTVSSISYSGLVQRPVPTQLIEMIRSPIHFSSGPRLRRIGNAVLANLPIVAPGTFAGTWLVMPALHLVKVLGFTEIHLSKGAAPGDSRHDEVEA